MTMLYGLHLHAERGVDAVLAEAQAADAQGFDSVWTGDHLLPIGKDAPPETPLETWTLMTAIGAQTHRVRLGFAMLNPSFRNPALLAKMLATLDQITRGRVICSIGAGWFEDEYTAYDVPFIADHDERIAHEREVVQLLRELWTSSSPVTFEGRFVSARNLAFGPHPYQQPHPPIWIGGNSSATQALVAELADGWVLLSRGDIAPVLNEARSRADWPEHELVIVGGAQYQPDDTLRERLSALESIGVNYVRMTFASAEQQAAFAEANLRPELAAPSR